MSSILQKFCASAALSWVAMYSGLAGQYLEYNVPVSIRSQQFNRSFVLRAEFVDLKATDSAAPFEFVAVSDDHVAAKDGSALVVLKSAANPDKTGPINFNENFTIIGVKAGTGAWSDKVGFFAKRRMAWTFPGSKWGDKDGVHYQPRFSDDVEPALKTDAVNFAIVNPSGKSGPVSRNEVVNIVSRATGPSNNRIMWVLNLDQSGVLPVLISSDDPWGRDPKSSIGGDRRLEAGKLTISEIDTQLLNDQGWKDLARVVQDGIAKPGGRYAAGGRSFVYEPAVFGRGMAAYSDQWKSDKPGTIWAKVRARAKSDIILYVSTQPKWMDAAGTYCFFFGSYKNTRSQLRKGTQVVMEVDVTKGGDPSALVSGGLPANGSMWDDYWVSVEQRDDGKAVLSAGKGVKVGENVKMTWTDEQPLKFVQYLGLGGWEGLVEYDKISQMGNEHGAQLPADFAPIPGMVRNVALGMYEGNAILYALSKEGSLLQWDSGSLNPNPWNLIEVKDSQGGKLVKLLDVASAADGTLAVVNNKRRVYFFNRAKNFWQVVPNNLFGRKKKKIFVDRIALGNAETLIGLDKKTKNIYLFHDDSWMLLSEGVGLDIAAGYDGSLYALNTKHELFVLNEKLKWSRMESTLAFSMISAVTRDELYGIVLDGKKRKTYTFSNGAWEPLQTPDGADAVGLHEILGLPSKPSFLIVMDELGNVYKKGETTLQINDGVKKGAPVTKNIVLKKKPKKNFKISAANRKAQANIMMKKALPADLLTQKTKIKSSSVKQK